MASPEALQQLAQLLSQSVQHSQSKQAEKILRGEENSPGFSIMLLQVVASSHVEMNARLAGAVFFKNFIKRKWTDEDGNYRIPEQDVGPLKSEIIGLMIQLQPALQVQIGEAVSTIADSDFPERWPNLIPDLVSRLGSDIKTNNGVLTVAHSIFKRWRPLFRSDELFKEIQLVLSQFTEPFKNCLVETDRLIQGNSGDKAALQDLFQSLLLLVEIYFDLNSQDIPEFFEDNIDSLMQILHRYLQYNNPLLATDDDDETGPVEQVKSSICELLELYTQRYGDVFDKLLPNFVESTWQLLTTTGLEPKYDFLVSKALGFLTAVARTRQDVFNSDEILETVIKSIVVPNMALRESDEEMFEDDPIEFIRRDLEGSDSDSRRRSATDFLRELATKLEAKVTEVAMKYVNGFLSQFNNNRGNWKAKDTAIYLFSSIAVKGNVTSVGVSSTNLLVDVISFFQQNVLPDLLGDVKPSSPILTVDAIKYIHTFRNQLTKEQLLEAFKLLSMHLHSSEYVVYTYAAITIERVLSIRGNDGLMVSRVDIADVVGPLLSALFSLILKNRSTPEKLAENEFLMKCVMRVLITTQDSIKGDTARGVLVKLLEIVGEIAKNPSNPRFTHYTFESIGAVIRFSYAPEFDTLIIEPFLGILGNDVTEFIPYALQILAQLLQAKPSSQGLPQQYEMLVQPLMAPVLWEAKGNVPALVMLLEAILAHGGGHLFEGPGKLTPLLGVFQKLIATRSHDAFGFDLLEHIFAFVSLDAVRPYLRDIAALLLRRLQDSRTDKYVARLSKFEYFLSAIETRPDLGPVFAVDLIDSAQEGIFGQVLTQFMLPATLQLVNSKDRKLAIIGLCRILCENPKFTSGSYSAKFGDGLRTLVQLLQGTTVDSRADEDLLSGDMEFDSLTFGSSFSKLQTAAFQRYDPIPNVSNAKDVFASSIRKLAASHPDAIRQVVSTLPPDQQTELKNLGLA